jgi:hypothetical protein
MALAAKKRPGACWLAAGITEEERVAPAQNRRGRQCLLSCARGTGANHDQDHWIPHPRRAVSNGAIPAVMMDGSLTHYKAHNENGGHFSPDGVYLREQGSEVLSPPYEQILVACALYPVIVSPDYLWSLRGISEIAIWWIGAVVAISAQLLMLKYINDGLTSDTCFAEPNCEEVLQASWRYTYFGHCEEASWRSHASGAGNGGGLDDGGWGAGYGGDVGRVDRQ